jgi:hypothetical protein
MRTTSVPVSVWSEAIRRGGPGVCQLVPRTLRSGWEATGLVYVCLLDSRNDEAAGFRAWSLGLVVIVFVMSALGYLFVPTAMLSIVGIEGNRQVEFLVAS